MRAVWSIGEGGGGISISSIPIAQGAAGGWWTGLQAGRQEGRGDRPEDNGSQRAGLGGSDKLIAIEQGVESGEWREQDSVALSFCDPGEGWINQLQGICSSTSCPTSTITIIIFSQLNTSYIPQLSKAWMSGLLIAKLL